MTRTHLSSMAASNRARLWTRRILLLLMAEYCLIVLLGWGTQRRYVYHPNPTYRTPASAGLTHVEEHWLRTPDANRLVAWWAKARPGQPTFLYLHGNSENLARRAPRITTLHEPGFGVFMLAWRGFSGSTGFPSEVNNIADAALAFDYLREQGLKAQDIVIYGESIGTGAALPLATTHPAAGVVLESPFTSITEIAKRFFPILPIGLMMNERYDNLARIEQVHMPVLIVHGERDRLVPVEMGRRLLAAANEPKSMVAIPDARHNNVFRLGGAKAAIAFAENVTSGKARTANRRRTDETIPGAVR